MKESEWQTRKQRVDTPLRARLPGGVQPGRRLREEDYGQPESVDISALGCLVFLRPVKSCTLWEQIL